MKDEALEQGDFNPYAAPAAKVDDAAAARGGEPVFFPVSGLKLALMTLATFGFYEIYWFYKNWKCVQQNYGESIVAPVRAVFYPIVSYWLFTRIRDHARREGVAPALPAGPLAIAVFVCSLLLQLPDPWWLTGFLGILPLVGAQSTVNALNRKLAPSADPNSRFSGWNIFGLVVGGILFAMAVLGSFLPE